MKTMLFKQVGDVFLVVHSDRPPTDDEWNAYTAAIVAAGKARGGSLASIRNLVITDGGGPNAGQRKSSNDALAQLRDWKTSIAAVVSANATVRGIVTVLNWLSVPIKSFSPSNMNDAFAFLNLRPDEIDKLMVHIKLLKGELESSTRRG